VLFADGRELDFTDKTIDKTLDKTIDNAK